MCSTCLFPTDLFEQTGQYEPLTTRIRNILREYKDGVGIFKELIQNADDAGATEVKFLVDWRNGRTNSLFSTGMAECQGPALWAYNNALFTDEDFENINKLAGETKVEDISKIGRFGLGFNAVYHLTDVPSFISREHFVVFDPNTHHLQRHIQNRARPGIRINLAEKPGSLTRYQDQFQPYNGIFGFNTTQTRGDFYYNATLFRFPFRTASQASTSDIIKTAYDRDKIKAIVRSLCECASTLFIFCQHVKEVKVYELDDGSSQPDEMRLVLSVKKSTAQPFRGQEENNEEPFIMQCSKWWQQYRESQTWTEFPSGYEFVNILTTKEPSELSGRDRPYSSDQVWLVVSASGTGASLKIACSPEGRERGFLPCGGAAFVVQRVSNQGSEESSNDSDLLGELFCFLPLSIRTGLPVHVNGYFAIMSNRAEIWKRSILQTQPIEVEWNDALMRDALTRAYIMLLEKMKELIGQVQHYNFHTLWPSIDAVDMKSWKTLVQKICYALLDPETELFYSNGKWMSINDGFILSEDFNEINETVVEVLRSLGTHVFNLPPMILQTLVKFDRWKILQKRTLTFTKFMEQCFFPNIRTLSPTLRDLIVCLALDRSLKGNKSSLPSCTQETNLLKRKACISVSQDGQSLAKPCDLIHPSGPAAELFSEQDHRFPVGDGLRERDRLYVLEKLGMVKDLDWIGIYETAKSIAKTRALERCRKLIVYINKRIYELPKSAQYRSLLQPVAFLPVLKKPVGEYLLPWKGSSSLPFCAPNEVFLPKDAKVVGSSCLIVDTSDESGCGKMNVKVKNFFGLSGRLPEDRSVIQQLDEAFKFWSQLSEQEKQKKRMRSATESVCQSIYKFFNNKVVEKERNPSSLNELGKRNWLFLQGTFVQSKVVAYTSNGNGAPFLFTLPPNYIRDYQNLFEMMQIKRTFGDEDYINALYELESTKQGNVLPGNELQTAIFFISQIDVQNPTMKDYIGHVPLPDTDCILRRSKDLVVNLSLWLKDPENNLKVHEKVPPQTALALGAKSLKNVILKKYSHRIGYGESFEQHEELTDRLKGILDGYPTDGILKELVQNADDAQASEIHFIHDTRSLGCVKVATEEKTSAEIQGPALCVYNDKPFTPKDLDGIRNLGIGSKRDTPGMTGKYGIGFNSVYHLTDCPSFLSNDDTLVFLDPHCRYFDDGRGQIFKSMDEKFRNINSDTLDGYLADHFNLQDSTMFRLPLRREKNESKISNVAPDMVKLFQTFQEEARKSLLFLNHVKKITISKIHPNNKLEEIYRVESVISSEDEKKRRELARKCKDHKDTPTADIGWEGINYSLTIKENKEKVEEWLIQVCIGSIVPTSTANRNCEIPDGRKLGFLPRGGVAARLWMRPSSSRRQTVLRGIVYCFLPLPENYTNLPVHVNGHFALDSTRRGLWTDTDGKGDKCRWNHFMKSCVLPPAYAALITEARNHLCDDEADKLLSRYHGLFPNVSSDSSWKSLAIQLYRYLGQTRANVLPLLVPAKSENEATEWLSADQAYFKNSQDLEDFLYLLIRIGLPVLLHAPNRIHYGFSSAGITSHEVSPNSVIGFLREFKSSGSTCKIGNLSKKLETTVVKSVKELSVLIKYCREDESFGKHLEGLPLLLTQDGYLKSFETSQPVFLSTFGDLFSTQSHLFVHSEIVHQIPRNATKSKESIVREFSVHDLAGMLPHVFTDEDLGAIKDATWSLPAEGILSEQWFKRLWDFLQNYAKPEPGKGSVSLDCLWEWPVIPTTCGKLVTIKNAKTVLDMTVVGYESAQQENVRMFLSKLACPVLKKQIISARSVVAVTDPYVAHPHNVRDVLVVLHHMFCTNKHHFSKVCEDDVSEFLRFVQDNYQRSGMNLEQCKQIVKTLPFHKTLDGQFVSLTGHYSSYALIPSGVPTQQLDELQNRAECLFLNSDVFPTLEKLYSALGVKGGKNVTQFYVEYVFRHFKIFSRESQMKHLEYIKDIVFPSLPQGGSIEKMKFLNSMTENPCIPDEIGRLHVSSDFFDPTNDVFKVMFVDDFEKFPPSPFNDTDWSGLLKHIGLKVNVTPQLFLQFCEWVAENGRQNPSRQQHRLQSEELVKCLFSGTALRGKEFLSQVSQIKFITSAKVEEKLTSIHEQYQCPNNSYPPFVKFSNAVPWDFRLISWTTVAILPDSAQLNDMAELNNLGIACSGPAYTNVVDHLQNVVNSSNPKTVGSELLHEITKSIYKFLSDAATQCCGPNQHDRCSKCMNIATRLNGTSCIFLQEDNIFVKAEQLVFKPPDKFPFEPFLFPVPPEFGELQHFLKRLGATDRPTPLQIAYVLRSIHELVGEELLLSSDQEKKVKDAMRMLFRLLHKGKSADGIKELFLPSHNRQLIKSCEMVCKFSPRFTEVIENLQRPILLRFNECGLKKPADVYIDSLPKHLCPVKFDDIVREDVSPECKRSICPDAQGGSICKFQEKFQNLLQSDEFQEGLKRLLMHDQQNPQKFEQKIKKLQMDVKTKCTGFESIKVQVIHRDTNEILDNLENSCYAEQNKLGNWSLYMQHELKGDKGLVSTASCVNKILGDCIQKGKLGLIAMLNCSSSSEISMALDKLDIAYSTSKSADDFAQSDELSSESESDDEHGDTNAEGGPGTSQGKRHGFRGGSGGGGGGHSR